MSDRGEAQRRVHQIDAFREELARLTTAQVVDLTAEQRQAIAAYHDTLLEQYGVADYATEDWNHINPYGGRDRGRKATLKTVRQVHKTFLKGTSDTIEDMDIRFADQDVAVGTVTSVSSPVTTPDGVKHGEERHIRTFVVVKRGRRWLIMQDHNTTVREVPAR